MSSAAQGEIEPAASKQSSATTCCKCLKGGVSMNKCSGCRVVAYCSVACQKADWVAHKPMCGKCANCGKQGASMKQCAACRCVQYCGRECQLAQWKAHKKQCKVMKERGRPTKWVNWGLRGRFMDPTYGMWEYADQPRVAIMPQYAHIKSLFDIYRQFSVVEQHFYSYTGCFFDFDVDKNSVFTSGLFYRDQQDCVRWMLNEFQQVVADVRWGGENMDTETRVVVADSLPEFLTRVHIERQHVDVLNSFDEKPLRRAELQEKLKGLPSYLTAYAAHFVAEDWEIAAEGE